MRKEQIEINNDAKEKFEKIIIEEQETVVNISYADKYTDIYTSKKSVYFRLIGKLGEPTDKYYNPKTGEVNGAYWIIPFSDKTRTKLALSRPLLIGSIGDSKSSENTDEESEE